MWRVKFRVPIMLGLLLLTTPSSAPCGERSKPLVAGRFGLALDSRRATATAREVEPKPPLTVECWAKVESKETFNILVASGPKESGAHWEFYTYAGSGRLSAYLPDFTPAEIVSGADVTDGRWHHVAMVLDGLNIRLRVDGREVVNRPIVRQNKLPVVPGTLTFGHVVGTGGGFGCDGLVDEVRISSTARPITIPEKPFEADAETLGLWHFDGVDNRNRLVDASVQANHARTDIGRSLDEVDAESYHAGPSPLASAANEILLEAGKAEHPQGPGVVKLDGPWQLAEAGSETERLGSDWPDAIPAAVPGSVHDALFRAGKIPDPKFGRNDAIAHEQSFKTWWYRTTFPRPAGLDRPRLVFDGVAITCDVWLNGRRLGSHAGMFGGLHFDVTDMLRDTNTLVVRIAPAPGDPKAWNNPAWNTTVVFNNVWGWHYSSIPALGIWRSVRIEGQPSVRLNNPFVAASDALRGIIDLSVTLTGASPTWSGTLRGTIAPENFKGSAHRFALAVRSAEARSPLHLRFTVPDARLWWPNDLGTPNLYRLTLSFEPDGVGKADRTETIFGIRSITMAPLPNGPRATQYNWTFVVNGRPTFIKGAGWCTMDSSMDFSRARYKRFLELARRQHIQMVRGWGSGMPETDDFYDLCDQLGILVFQEWPTAWNSHNTQPYDQLEETVRFSTLRIRNHPSLALYGGGNESGAPFGKAIDMMGRYAVELDGTRVFHRGEPWGGSTHNYNCYWGRQPLDHNLKLTSTFFGEFGLACMPVLESVLRYLPEAERSQWPPRPDGSLVHHTPIFGTADDWSRLTQYASYFVTPTNLPTFITGSQLSQVVGVRHTLERARTRWPECTGALYYKMNDNYPAASWSCVDWYGAPKLSHFFFQQSFAPLHACVLFDSVNNKGKPVAWPVVLLDDADSLQGASWQVVIRSFDARLREIKRAAFTGQGPIDRVKPLGAFELTATQTDTAPLFVVAEIKKNGAVADRTFYFVNYESPMGCLFTTPRTSLSLRVERDKAIVTNTGTCPAVCVRVERPGHADTFLVSENCLWLEPGESRALNVNSTGGLTVQAWNRD